VAARRPGGLPAEALIVGGAGLAGGAFYLLTLRLLGVEEVVALLNAVARRDRADQLRR
jgi:threonine dehydrogenase-like Zn-dependent dehydrogenase